MSETISNIGKSKNSLLSFNFRFIIPDVINCKINRTKNKARGI